MNRSNNPSIRIGALVAFLLLIAGLSGCGGGSRIMGRLDYMDVPASTGGDSVWVQLQGQESVGATVIVKADNTWVYQPKNTKIRSWSGEYPPIKKQSSGDDDPVLVIQALTPTHRTKIQYVNYVELKSQKDKLIRLMYELLPGTQADTTSRNETDRVKQDSEIRP